MKVFTFVSMLASTSGFKCRRPNIFSLAIEKRSRDRREKQCISMWSTVIRTNVLYYEIVLIDIRCLSNMDQAQPTDEHRIYAQTCTCTNGSFEFFSSLFLIIFLCSPFRLTQLIPLQRRFFGPRYIGDDFFYGPRYIGDDFFQGRNKKVQRLSIF